MIRFQNGAKLLKLLKALGLARSKGVNFDLPAGWTCPGAKDCKSKADPFTGKIEDGPETKFRCYAASLEAAYRATRDYRWEQFHDCLMLLSAGGPELLAQAFYDALPEKVEVVRAHTSGDFFNLDYAKAWALFARMRPDVTFYAYTKSVRIVNAVDWPDNFRITVSHGGRYDYMPTGHIRAFVVSSVGEAQARGLPVDDDDTHAYRAAEDFALVVHGTQPKGGHRLPVLED